MDVALHSPKTLLHIWAWFSVGDLTTFQLLVRIADVLDASSARAHHVSTSSISSTSSPCQYMKDQQHEFIFSVRQCTNSTSSARVQHVHMCSTFPWHELSKPVHIQLILGMSFACRCISHQSSTRVQHDILFNPTQQEFRLFAFVQSILSITSAYQYMSNLSQHESSTSVRRQPIFSMSSSCQCTFSPSPARVYPVKAWSPIRSTS